MAEVRFSELPEGLRVKLSEDVEDEMWHRAEEFGGITELSEHFGFSRSKMYNWKNKEAFIPVEFVQRLMGDNNTSGITALKGRGRSRSIERIDFPLTVPEEILTRAKASVSVNSDGVPTYITDEASLARRFEELLTGIGEVPYKTYSREGRFEVRYPKFLQEIFASIDYKEDFPAKVDEEGIIENEKVKTPSREIRVENFSGKLYSRERKFELALQRGDREEIRDIIGAEASKVDKLLSR